MRLEIDSAKLSNERNQDPFLFVSYFLFLRLFHLLSNYLISINTVYES